MCLHITDLFDLPHFQLFPIFNILIVHHIWLKAQILEHWANPDCSENAVRLNQSLYLLYVWVRLSVTDSVSMDCIHGIQVVTISHKKEVTFVWIINLCTYKAIRISIVAISIYHAVNK